MSFSAALVFGIISLCLGGILGCCSCVLAGISFHKRYLKSHFTIICILLSIAVAFAAGGFILIKDLPSQIHLLGSYWLFLAVLFAVGALSACFWKIVLPLAVFFYILISAVTGLKLYGHFGSQLDTIPVVVNQDSVKIQNDSFFVDSIGNKSLVVEVYTIPGVLVMPLPRVWYSVIGVADSNIEFEQGTDLRSLSGFSGQAPVAEEEKSGLLWAKQIDIYMKWVLKNRKNLLIPVPADGSLPVLYELNFTAGGETLSCRLNKKL